MSDQFASKGLTAGQLNAIVKKLGGHDAALAFLDGKLVVKPFERKFETWKTLIFASSAKAYRKALTSAGFRISEWADDILGKTPISVTKTQLDLVLVTVAELGFPSGATRADIYTRAQELGLKLCPAEVGPALRLAYTDQPKNEWLLVGMEPITASRGRLGVFNVGHDSDERWLDAGWSGADFVWCGGRRWVFSR